MKVKNLIKKLQEYPNQEVDVFIYDVEENESHNISMVDLTITDRVDLNIKKHLTKSGFTLKGEDIPG
jgi:hypothetical protein